MGVRSWSSGLGPFGLAPNPNISIGRGLACPSEHFSRILQLTPRAFQEVGTTSEGRNGQRREAICSVTHVRGP